jgi:hypothetical protein
MLVPPETAERGIDQIRRVQELGAVLALVAAGALIAAVGAFALDIAVGQEAAVVLGVDLIDLALLDEAVFIEFGGEMLRQFVIVGGGAAAEIIEGDVEALIDVALHFVLLAAEVSDVLAGLQRGELRGRAVFVGRADIEHLVAGLALEARIDVRRQDAADQIAEMLHPVDVGQRAGDQDFHRTRAFLRYRVERWKQGALADGGRGAKGATRSRPRHVGFRAHHPLETPPW